MLDSVVLAQFRKIELVVPIRAAQKVGGELGYEEAEGRCEIKGLSNSSVQLTECYVFAVVREDAVISPSDG